MGMYLNASLELKMPDTPDVKKVICDTLLSFYESDLDGLMEDFGVSSVEDLCKTAHVEDLLGVELEIDELGSDENGNNGYSVSYNDDCSYSFSEELTKMFMQLAPYLEDESGLELQSDDDGDWYESYVIKNHEVISGTRHDFYTDKSGEPSDDKIAEAIIKAAERLQTNPDSKDGLRKKMMNVESVNDIIEVLLG